MLEQILNALKAIINAIFGGERTSPTSEESRPSVPSKTPLPTSPPAPPNPQDPQDATEIRPESVVVVVSERDLNPIVETEYENTPQSNSTVNEDQFDRTADQTDGTFPGGVISGEHQDISTDRPTNRTPRYLWCLDNGHGKLTLGKRSPLFDDGSTRFFEYEFNRDIVRRIIAKLESLGVAYFNVVPEVNVDNFLEGRVYRANRRSSALPKLYVSIHANAAPARSPGQWGPPDVSGIETWHYYGSREGQRIAAVFQKHLLAQTGWKNRHLKSRARGQFYVLRSTNMPAILTENGFYNNETQAQELMRDATRQKIADAHVAAILEVEEKGLEGLALKR